MAWTALLLMVYGSWSGWWDPPFRFWPVRWIGGMTLPSGDYLKGNPDFVPKGAAVPIPEELKKNERRASDKEKS